MAMCEDFPCCGHDHGTCPTEDGPVCVGCQAQLPPHAQSSLCDWCRARLLNEQEGGYWDDEFEEDEL